MTPNLTNSRQPHEQCNLKSSLIKLDIKKLQWIPEINGLSLANAPILYSLKALARTALNKNITPLRNGPKQPLSNFRT